MSDSPAIHRPTASLHYAAGNSLPADLAERLEEQAWTHGEMYDSYLATEPDRDHYFANSGEGLLAFVELRRFAHVFGGPIAPPDQRDALLAEFHEFAKPRYKVIAYYNLTWEDAQRLAGLGYQLTKCGEEPLVDLTETTWRGKPFEWLRRQENYCRRQGLECLEVPVGSEALEQMADELRSISDDHVRRSPHGRELRYVVGRFDPHQLRRRRLFIVAGSERIEALIVCNPASEGRTWALDVLRQRHDAPRGVLPFAVLSAMRTMQAEGVVTFSLAAVPMLRPRPLPGDSRLFRVGSRICWNRFNWIYDAQGLHHFKSRFRPTYRELFIAAWPRLTFWSLESFLDVWDVSNISLGRFLRNGLRALRRPRRQLAEPE